MLRISIDNLDPMPRRSYPKIASRLDDRCARGAEESPGSTETRRRITSGGGDPRESATESKPPKQAPGSQKRQG